MGPCVMDLRLMHTSLMAPAIARVTHPAFSTLEKQDALIIIIHENITVDPTHFLRSFFIQIGWPTLHLGKHHVPKHTLILYLILYLDAINIYKTGG